MDHSPALTYALSEAFAPAVRRDGWSPARKAAFLNHLAVNGDVRAACARVRISPQAAYVQRRRDPLFARSWMAALVLAQDHAGQVLASRALDGVEEPIFYRGEQVGSRRRYDSRLLLAHLARLDSLVQCEEVQRDAGRFDELLALVAGARPPEDLAGGKRGLPRDRESHAESAALLAEEACREELPALTDADEREQHEMAAGDLAYAAAAAEWDGWFAQACATVDRLDEAAEEESAAAETFP